MMVDGVDRWIVTVVATVHDVSQQIGVLEDGLGCFGTLCCTDAMSQRAAGSPNSVSEEVVRKQESAYR